MRHGWRLMFRTILPDDGTPPKVKDALQALSVLPRWYKHGKPPWSSATYSIGKTSAHGPGRLKTMYNPSKGMLLSAEQELPIPKSVEGSGQPDSIQGPVQWSNIAWFGWLGACTTAKAKPRGLRYVLDIVRTDQLTQ